MRDRLSTKILSNGATRYGVYDETGNLLRYEYIKLEDEPTVEGDLFSKANMLPDSIPAALGLKMGNPQVKDALNVLANIGNVHVWQRVQTYADPVPEVPAGYTLGAVETDVLLVSKAGETSVSISYSDSISVDANGNVSLASVNTISYVISEWREHYSVLQGKFCQVMDSTSGGITDAGASIFFFPSDAILEYAQAANYKLTLTAKKYQSVTGYPYTPAIPAGTHVDYLTSTDRNAYPDNVTGAQDAYYTLGDTVTGEFIISTLAKPTVDYKYHVSSSVVVSEDGTVHLSGDYITVYFSHVHAPTKSDFAGKFVQYYGRSSSGETDSPPDTNPPFNSTPSQIVYVPNDVNIIITTPSYIDRYQPVTGHAAIPANTTITYLGQLGGGARIEVGSYVGTGTYGSSNPNSLTFGFKPKIVELLFRTSTNVGGGDLKNEDLTGEGFNRSQNFMVADRLTAEYAQGEGFGYSRSSSHGKKSPDGKTFYWYSSNAENQCNSSKYVYYYIAIY